MRAALLIVVVAATQTASAAPGVDEPPSVRSRLRPTGSQREGLYGGGAVEVGPNVMAEAHFGWMIESHGAIFASVIRALSDTDEAQGFTLALAGLRVWVIDRGYVDVRAGVASASHHECTPGGGGGPCTQTGLGWRFAVGGEVMHTRRFGLDLQVGYTGGPGESVVTGGLGIDLF